MVDVIYVEREALGHPRVREITNRFPGCTEVVCDRYTEIFNPKSQSFRLQKRNPALILALKQRNFVSQTPEGHGVGSECNFYFSHMLNCLYDCRYCFLQGMYRSAHYVVFVNYEDFEEAIRAQAKNHTAPAWFFSGYDCDSLAYEPVTGFAKYFVPVFAGLENCRLELRTKSTQVRCLSGLPASNNVVVGFSFTPEPISNAFEHKVPSVTKRIDAIRELQKRGWRVGLRFDPMIHHHEFEAQYATLFSQIFGRIDVAAVHSVTLGAFRMPKGFYRTLVKHYPEERLLAGPLGETSGVVSYARGLERDMMAYCQDLLLRYVPNEIVYAHLLSSHDPGP